MDTEKRLSLGIIVALMIILLSVSIFAQSKPNPGHSAAEIGGGTFNASFGAFTFPRNLTVTNSVFVSGAGVMFSGYGNLAGLLVGNGTSTFGIVANASNTGMFSTVDYTAGSKAVAANIKNGGTTVVESALAYNNTASSDTVNGWIAVMGKYNVGGSNMVAYLGSNNVSVYGFADGSIGNAYAGYFRADNAASVGVYAKGGKHAGYFEGNVSITQNLSVGSNICLGGTCRTTWPSGGGGGITGSGDVGNISLFVTNSTNIGSSAMYQSGDDIGIGSTVLNPEGWDRVLDLLGSGHAKLAVRTATIDGRFNVHDSGYYGAPAGAIIGTYSNHPTSFITNALTRMSITAGGRVGINTTSPASMLHVQGGTIIGNYSGSNSPSAGVGVFGSGTYGVEGKYDANHIGRLGSSTTGVSGSVTSGYGVYGGATTGTGVGGLGNIGVWGYSTNIAGYFDGNVTITNSTSNAGLCLNGVCRTTWPSAGTIDGSGSNNNLTKWTDGDTITSSIMYENSGKIGVKTSSPVARLHVEEATIGAAAFGEAASATGASAVAIGYYTNASAWASFAAGDRAVAINDGAVSMGSLTNASGFYSFAAGYKTKATNNEAFAAGWQSNATGQQAFALGYNALSSGISSYSMGTSTSATDDYTYAFGRGSSANSDYAVAFGHNMIVNGFNSFGISLSDSTYTIDDSSTMAIMGGEVGIGTTSPASMLHVQGGMIIGNDSGAAKPGVSGIGVYGTGSNYGVAGEYVTDRYGLLGGSNFGTYGQYNSTVFGILGNDAGQGVRGNGTLGVIGTYLEDRYGALGFVDWGAYGQYNASIIGAIGSVDTAGTFININPSSEEMYGVVASAYSAGGGERRGVYGYAGTSTGPKYGVYGLSDGGVGVYGRSTITGASGILASVMGNSSGQATHAGYFIGNVSVVSGNLSIGPSSQYLCINGDCRNAWPSGGSMSSWTIAGDDDSSSVTDGQTVTIAGSATIDTAQTTRSVAISVQADSIDDAQVVNDGLEAGSLAVDSVSDSELDGGFGWTLDTDLNIDSNTLVVSQDDNRVGIGTSAPSAKLDVETPSGGAATFGSSTNTATGNFSVSMGIDSDATGNFSTAMGGYGTASGTYSTSMGFTANAAGQAAVAMGWSSYANGTYSTAMGYSTIASGTYSTAMGDTTNAYGQGSTAMGGYSNASGLYSVAAGYYTQAKNNYAVAIGYRGSATGQASTAMGSNMNVSGSDSFGIGLTTGTKYNLTDSNTLAIMGGEVGIGTLSPDQALKINGSANVTGTVYYGGNLTGYGSDFAEMLPISGSVGNGDVVCFDESMKVKKCASRADPAVAGVVSERPTIIGNGAEKGMPVGITGIVPTKVKGPIARFDLLTSSSKPGFAEKATKDDFGAIIGKAMEPCDKESCTIKVLVGLR
jgi:hypothetical protein